MYVCVYQKSMLSLWAWFLRQGLLLNFCWQTCFHQLVPGVILPVFPQCWVTDPQWPKNIFYLIWQSHTHVQCSLILPFINCSWRLPNPLSCLHDNCPPIPSSLRPVSADCSCWPGLVWIPEHRGHHVWWRQYFTAPFCPLTLCPPSFCDSPKPGVVMVVI